MKIAILGSVAEKIPPQGQAAIERLAYYQAVGLADRGHKVTLFALVGSKVDHPNIKLVEVGEGGSLLGIGKKEKVDGVSLYGASYKMRLEITNLAFLMQRLRDLENDFDVVLNNLRGAAVLIPYTKYLNKPFYHVMHLPIFPQLADLFRENNTELISISDKQRTAFPDLNYVGTVYNGVDISDFAFSSKHDNYVLYLGSIGANKNPKDAVLAAKQSGQRMIIGGRIKDKEYYDIEIAPYIDGERIRFIGETTKEQIIKIYQYAKAFIFPTLWEEPFGLVVVEALSCGTPVIAYPNGALPEIIEDGKNGYLVNNINEIVEKMSQIENIDRAYCRKTVEDKFSIDKMIDRYESILSKHE